MPESNAAKNNNGLIANNIVYFILAYMFLALESAIDHGLFTNMFQFFFVLFAIAALAMPHLNIRFLDKIYLIASVKNLLLMGAAVSMLIFSFFDSGIYLESEKAAEKIFILKFITLAIFLFYFIKTNAKTGFFHNLIRQIIKYKFSFLIILAIATRIATILSSPLPSIDVFYVTNESVDNLIGGINPYSASYTSPWPDWYTNPSYLPAVIFMNMPGRIIFGDVRFGYMIAQLIIATIIYLILRKKYATNKILIELLILMFMFLPNSLFVLEQTWIEPLILLALFLFALIFIKQKLSYLACVILGILISLKQNHFPFFILALTSFRFDLKKILILLSAMLLPIIPFLLWDLNSFVYATMTYPLNYRITIYSISLNTLSAMFSGREIPHYLSLGAILILIIFLSLKTKKDDLLAYLHSSITIMFLMFFMIWGYANYYYLISGSLVLLITIGLLRLPPENELPATKPIGKFA